MNYKIPYTLNGTPVFLDIIENNEDIEITIGETQAKLLMSWNIKNEGIKGALLHSFYVYSKELKGIGKFMLCTAVSIGIKNKRFKTDYIYLEADGDRGSDKEYTPEQIESFFAKYPVEITKMEEEYEQPFDQISDKSKSFKINLIIDNAKLIEYYTRYGFEQMKPGEGLAVLMRSSINSIHDYCLK